MTNPHHPTMDWSRSFAELGDVLNFRVNRFHLMYHHDYRIQSGESIRDFITRVRTLAEKCFFSEDELNERLLEVLIHSTSHEGLRKELLGKPVGYSITDAILKGREYEEDLSRMESGDGALQDVKIYSEEMLDLPVLLPDKATPTDELCVSTKIEVEESDNDDHMTDGDWTAGENHFDHVDSTQDNQNQKIEADHDYCFAENVVGMTSNSTNDARQYVSKESSRKSKKPFKCDVCKKGFVGVLNLSVHMKIHNGEDPLKCDIDDCGKVCENISSMVSHIRTHTGEKPYKCDVCGNRYTRAVKLREHKKKNHTDSKIHKCPVCGEVFEQSADLSKHWRKHPDEKPVGCDYCDKRFITNHYKSQHVAIKHKGELSYKCDVCGENFTERSDLLVHKRTHTLKCNVCHEMFPTKSKLTEHEKIHTKAKCDVCGKICSSSKTLARHKKRHEKRYKCDHCDRRYRKPSLLAAHLRTHTGEKPYICDVCGKGFTVIGCLTSHKKYHHTGEKHEKSKGQLTICEICGKHLSHGSIAGHMLRHNPEKLKPCQFCGKAFTAYGMTRHLMIHTGEKPHQCGVCGKFFREQRQLTVHTRMHTGEKPCKCDICGKCFTWNSSLIKHLKSHGRSVQPKTDTSIMF